VCFTRRRFQEPLASVFRIFEWTATIRNGGGLNDIVRQVRLNVRIDCDLAARCPGLEATGNQLGRSLRNLLGGERADPLSLRAIPPLERCEGTARLRDCRGAVRSIT